VSGGRRRRPYYRLSRVDNRTRAREGPLLEVEVAANTVYAWAAHEILARRVAEERPSDPIEYAASVRHQSQALRYRAHDKLMRAFLDDEVFTGHVRIQPGKPSQERQTSLLDDG
jgi:hypothetical protein